MTEENIHLKKSAAEIVKKVATKTLMLVSLAVAGTIAFSLFTKTAESWWFFPAGVLFGGALGLVNFHWLAVTVEKVYVRKGATPTGANLAGAIINILKLSVIFIVLFIIIKWNLLHIFGLLTGLSLCFLAIIWEGITLMNRGVEEGNENR